MPSIRLTLIEALYFGFEAKNRAEMAGGVSRSTVILFRDERCIKEIMSATIKTPGGNPP